jgi:hypothetical protein
LILLKSRRNEVVVYFCRGSALRAVSEAVAELRVGNVAVRRLECDPPRPLLVFPPARRGVGALDGERQVAGWVSEQGAARLDHLAEVLSVSVAEADRVLDGFVEVGSLGRCPGLAGEADWFWVRHRGARLADNGLGCGEGARYSRFERLAVVNRLRLGLESSDGVGVWISGRVLRLREAEAGRGGSWQHFPDGVVIERDGSRTAVYAVLRVNRNPKIPRLLQRFAESFDRVLCLGPMRVRTAVGEMARARGLTNVVFGDLAGRKAVIGPAPSRRRILGPLPIRESVPRAVRQAVRL